MATTSNGQAEVEFYARVDAAGVYASYVERMAAAYGDAAVTDWDVDALSAEAFGDGPEPPAPAAPNVVPFPRRPFDRVEHCRRIGAHGGNVTVARHGVKHMRTIGRAGAKVTITRHGYAAWLGHVTAKGWAGRRTADLPTDLAAARVLAAEAA